MVGLKLWPSSTGWAMQQFFELHVTHMPEHEVFVIIAKFIANFTDQTLAFIHTAETQHGNLHAAVYTNYKVYMTGDRSPPLIT